MTATGAAKATNAAAANIQKRALVSLDRLTSDDDFRFRAGG